MRGREHHRARRRLDSGRGKPAHHVRAAQQRLGIRLLVPDVVPSHEEVEDPTKLGFVVFGTEEQSVHTQDTRGFATGLIRMRQVMQRPIDQDPGDRGVTKRKPRPVRYDEVVGAGVFASPESSYALATSCFHFPKVMRSTASQKGMRLYSSYDWASFSAYQSKCCCWA